MVDPTQSNYLKALQELEARITDDELALRESATQPTGGQAHGGLSSVPMHLADLGTETFMQEIDATLMQSEQFTISEIQAAIKRLYNGTFGNCERCQQPIMLERLEAIPYTRYCTACSEVADSSPSANLDTGRPVRPSGSASQFDSAADADSPASDSAVGTAGGGTSIGGLAGTTIGRGDPNANELGRATSEADFDAETVDQNAAYAGLTGGAIGGTPAGKRVSGGRTASPDGD